MMRPEQSAWISELLLFPLVLADLGTAGLELAKNWTFTDSNQKRVTKMFILVISLTDTQLC